MRRRGAANHQWVLVPESLMGSEARQSGGFGSSRAGFSGGLELKRRAGGREAPESSRALWGLKKSEKGWWQRGSWVI